MDNQEKLYWKFDVSTFKLLGRELITDRITAVYELVKNSYDANATKVDIFFNHITKRSDKSSIIIRDNGIGMSIDDIKDKWMVVGTSSKRGIKLSPSPFFRRYIGEKGVGRFAVDKLGGHLHIRTRKDKDTQVLNVIINWGEYERRMKAHAQLEIDFQEFTKVANDYFYEDDNTFEVGTELKITMLQEAWDGERFKRLEDQLSRILSPQLQLKYPFKIFLFAPDFNVDKHEVKAMPFEKFATCTVIIPFDEVTKKQGSLLFDKETLSFNTEWLEAKSFGLLSMKLSFFDNDAINKFKKEFKYAKEKHPLEGVKVYRDGVICTPFAEYESRTDSRRDILGIDKRRYTEAFDKLHTREILGVVEITKERNPKIKEATNRQDFVENEAYKDLKDFIIKQLDILALYKQNVKSTDKKRIQNNLRQATADVKEFNKEAKQIAKDNPHIAPLLTNLIQLSGRVENFVTEGVKDQEQERKDFIRKENIYLSLMSLQDYATNLAHAIRLLLGKIKRSAEFFKTHYPNPEFEAQFIRYSSLIFDEMQRMSKVVDFMLSYAQIDIDPTEFRIKSFLTELLFSAYQIQFEVENISVQLEIREDLELITSAKFLEDVFQNLIANSIKALQMTTDKKIKCECFIHENELTIIFSDNGIGIKTGDEDKVFDIYYTTTAEQGGAGLGLYVAQKRMEALSGNIEVIPSIYAPDGASFKLTLPLNDK